MHHLQHLVAPRRPLPSPRSETRNGATSRSIITLPILHQFEPVLASSPKSYMVVNAAKKRVDGDEVEGVIGGMKSPPLPQRTKNKAAIESPRVSRLQPPKGLSSRTDANIYRYNQKAEQRMAIRPLFEQRKRTEVRRGSTKSDVKREDVVSTIDERNDETEEQRSDMISNCESEDEKRALMNEEIDGAHDKNNNMSSVIDDELKEIVDETGENDGAEESRDDLVKDARPESLTKIDTSSCYEPFLQTDGQDAIELVSSRSLSRMLATNDVARLSLDVDCSNACASTTAALNVELFNQLEPLQDTFKAELIKSVALLAQTEYAKRGVLSTLRRFQQQEAIQRNVAALMQQVALIDNEVAFNERVDQNLAAARMSKLKEIAIASIVDDMVLDLVAFECRAELCIAKNSGGSGDHYGSKVEAVFD